MAHSFSSLGAFKSLLSVVHTLDLVQVTSKLDWFSQEYNQYDDIERLRILLKKYILTEILKDERVDVELYRNCLKHCEVTLRSRSESGFPCAFIGCRHNGQRHRDYVLHLKKVHPNIKNIVCNYGKKCLRRFDSIEGLIVHLKTFHSKIVSEANSVLPLNNPVDEPCMCNRLSCGQIQFSRLKDFMTHYNTFHGSESRPCIFLNCNVIFSASGPASARNHFRLKHKSKGDLCLKVVHRLTAGTPGLQQSMILDANVTNEDISEDLYVEEDFNDFERCDNILGANKDDDVSDGSEYYLEYYAHFLNKLAYFKFVPQTTIQVIADEHIKISQKSLERQEKLLRKSLCDKGLASAEINDIVGDVIENDPFLNAQIKLNSNFKRTKYITDNGKYVSPREVLLNKADVMRGKKKDVYHYIPIVETFRNLIQDTSFLKMKELYKPSSNNALIDLKDGSHFKNNLFFQQNNGAYALIVYSDAVEVKNPLGSAKGSYKIVQIFYSLCEVVKNQRSKIDRLQLVMVFREKLLKKYSLHTILKPFVDDLLKLESGVEVQIPMPKIIKCGILCYVADNLEASTIGGFSTNFSSKDVCRICHIKYEDLEDINYGEHGLWTVEEYDEICRIKHFEVEPCEVAIASIEVEEESGEFNIPSSSDEESSDDCDNNDEMEDIDSRGLRMNSPFNALSSFHSVESLPLDLMHDLFEGILMIVIFDMC